MKRAIIFLLILLAFMACRQTTKKQAEEKLYKGMFSYVATTNEVAFTECGQEFSISMGIEKNDEFKALFKAYKKVQSDAVLDFAYVEFEGYVGDKIQASEMDDKKVVVITRFILLDKEKQCK